jgi:hypothetical protein
VEEQKVDVLSYENGFWNPISAEDIENELQTLPQLAREKAAEAGLTAVAERTLKEQLEQKIKMKQRMRVNFAPSPFPAPSLPGR